MPLFNRISFASVIGKHFDTLYDAREGNVVGERKVSLSDCIIFIILPLILGISLVWFKVFISENYVNILLTLLSIFAGLLFGLLPLVFQQGKELRKELKDDIGEIEKSIETISNIEDYKLALEAQCSLFVASHVENVKKCKDSINSLNDMIAFLKSKSHFFSTEPQLVKIKAKINEELFRNICFAILTAIFSIIAILSTQINFSASLKGWDLFFTFKSVINFVSFFLLSVFITTLLMILKRFSLLY